jgi:hypothetical protein
MTERHKADLGEGQHSNWPPAIDRNFCVVLELNYTGASEGVRHLKALRSEVFGIGR